MTMPRLTIFLAGLMLVIAGCAKSDGPKRRAEVATKGDLMPGEPPAFEAQYVSNQSSVKLLPARTISTEPLESFRTRNAERFEQSLALARGEKIAPIVGDDDSSDQSDANIEESGDGDDEDGLDDDDELDDGDDDDFDEEEDDEDDEDDDEDEEDE